MARIKTTGAEMKQFWANEDPEFWPGDSHVDGMWWQVNGVEQDDVDVDKLDDKDVVVVEGAIVNPLNDTDRDFAGVMKKWQKKLTHATLVVQLPKEHEEALATFLKGLKGKIVK
ncbi:hypothetical protein [Pseudomonas serbica]|jgi:hypothetical protein|uniref:hypothetical protein n=1 Tax=Pseudomonas serbica TaxID=2965074 RepID=UPI00237A80DB|nr:hypothetical protein [Pseudomonas serbica]